MGLFSRKKGQATSQKTSAQQQSSSKGEAAAVEEAVTYHVPPAFGQPEAFSFPDNAYNGTSPLPNRTNQAYYDSNRAATPASTQSYVTAGTPEPQTPTSYCGGYRSESPTLRSPVPSSLQGRSCYGDQTAVIQRGDQVQFNVPGTPGTVSVVSGDTRVCVTASGGTHCCSGRENQCHRCCASDSCTTTRGCCCCDSTHNTSYTRIGAPAPIRNTSGEAEVYHTTYACYDPNCKGGSACSHFYTAQNVSSQDLLATRPALTGPTTRTDIMPGPTSKTVTTTTTTYNTLPATGVNYAQMQLNGPHAGQLIYSNTGGVSTHPYLVTTNNRAVPATISGVPVVVPTTSPVVSGPPIYLGSVQHRGGQVVPQYRRLEY